jgi:hypothetical protein
MESDRNHQSASYIRTGLSPGGVRKLTYEGPKPAFVMWWIAPAPGDESPCCSSAGSASTGSDTLWISRDAWCRKMWSLVVLGTRVVASDKPGMSIMASTRNMESQSVPPRKERHAPPFMRWDQRGKPVLQGSLILIDGRTTRVMFDTEDLGRAEALLRLFVRHELDNDRLRPDSHAVRLYGPDAPLMYGQDVVLGSARYSRCRESRLAASGSR